MVVEEGWVATEYNEASYAIYNNIIVINFWPLFNLYHDRHVYILQLFNAFTITIQHTTFQCFMIINNCGLKFIH